MSGREKQPESEYSNNGRDSCRLEIYDLLKLIPIYLRDTEKLLDRGDMSYARINLNWLAGIFRNPEIEKILTEGSNPDYANWQQRYDAVKAKIERGKN